MTFQNTIGGTGAINVEGQGFALPTLTLISVSGKRIPVEIDTICVHGDEPTAVAMARTIRNRLEAHGVVLAPFARTASGASP